MPSAGAAEHASLTGFKVFFHKNMPKCFAYSSFGLRCLLTLFEVEGRADPASLCRQGTANLLLNMLEKSDDEEQLEHRQHHVVVTRSRRHRLEREAA